MATVHNPPVARRIPSLRWWIGGILFASTVINYLDRQTLSWLSPYLKVEYHWTNTDYAMIVIAFRITYTIGQTVIGRFMDRIGNARHGVALPYNYWTSEQWDRAIRELGLRAAVWKRDLGLYPKPAQWLFERSLHFIGVLEGERTSEPEF